MEIPWTQAPNPANALTIGQVWNQPTTSDILNIAAYGDAQQARMVQNKLAQMKLKDEMDERGYSVEYQNALSQNTALQREYQNKLQDYKNSMAGWAGTTGGDTNLGQPPMEPQAPSQFSPPQARTPGEIKALQAMQEKDASDFLEGAAPIFKQALDDGNNEQIQKLYDKAKSKNNPILERKLEAFGDINITGKQELEQTRDFTAEELAKINEKLPESLKSETPLPAGKYKIKTKGSKITGLDQVTPTGVPEISKEAQRMEQLEKKGKTDSTEYKALQKKLEGPEESNEYKDFISEQMKTGKTRTQALQAWNNLQVQRTGQKAEITVKAQGGEGDSFNQWTKAEQEKSYENFIINNQKPTFAWRDKAGRNAWERGYNQYLIDKGKTAEDVGETRYYRTAQKKALDNNEVYRVSADRFVSVIDQNIDLVKSLKSKYGGNYGRLVNSAVNNIKQGIQGSGDLMALQQALTSLSNEVAKVESGSMGVAEVSVQQAATWKKIHDYNLNSEDLDTVLDTSHKLGVIRKKSLRETTDNLRKQLGEKEVKPGEITVKPREKVWKQKNGTWVQE